MILSSNKKNDVQVHAYCAALYFGESRSLWSSVAAALYIENVVAYVKGTAPLYIE